MLCWLQPLHVIVCLHLIQDHNHHIRSDAQLHQSGTKEWIEMLGQWPHLVLIRQQGGSNSPRNEAKTSKGFRGNKSSRCLVEYTYCRNSGFYPSYIIYIDYIIYYSSK